MRTVEARHVTRLRLRPTAPFHFDGTVHKPSHFPTPDVDHAPGVYWQTLRWGARLFGIRLTNIGTHAKPALELAIFSDKPLGTSLRDEAARELRWRFDLDANLGEFCSRFRSDDVLGPVIRRWKGMRVSSAYSVYEFLVITIVLQNVTVRRSTQMLRALLERYGTQVRFDGKVLYGFWRPGALHAATEEELRALKVGYRAKSLKRVAEAFATGEFDPVAIRAMDRDRARRELLKLYGVGPASVWYILFEVFHHFDAFDVISPWEQKIYSRLLFDRELVPAKKVLAEVKRRWGEWRMLASHYIFEDLFWRRKTESVPWLEALVRR
jgi:3-methyladenine DNA glycosylase/8-oxoguanine DNA glycosylase